VVRVDSALPGQYMAVFTPNQSGVYTATLTGKVADNVVDSQITLERVREPTLGQRLGLLMGLRMVRLVGVVVIGLVVVLVGLLLGRRSRTQDAAGSE
jgi:hypothetical protein